MTPTEELKVAHERAQWTTVVCSLLTGFSGSVLKDFHAWPLLVVPVVFLVITLWWAVRTVRLRRQVRAAG